MVAYNCGRVPDPMLVCSFVETRYISEEVGHQYCIYTCATGCSVYMHASVTHVNLPSQQKTCVYTV